MNDRPSWLRSWWRRVMHIPRTRRAAWRVLAHDFGHARTVRTGKPIDAQGREIPWFTYPAIEYLAQLDLRQRTVFEFGAGNSTHYWARCAARIVSVESNREWYDRVRAGLPGNVELSLVENPAAYAAALTARAEPFDVIVVDGIERRACCRAAIAKLRPGGLVILDNSDWHHRCAALLREAGLLEVDFAGFGPINGYTWTTSLFFHRQFDFPSRHERQPTHGIGAMPHEEEP